MIIREAAIDSHWYRASAAWFIAFLLVGCVAYPSFTNMGHGTAWLRPFLWTGVAGSLLLYVIGRIRPKTPTRVLEFILVTGCLGLLPLLMAMGFAGLSYFLLTTHVTWLVWAIRILFIVVSALWCWRELLVFRKRVIERHFIEREFRIELDRIALSRKPKTNIDRPRLTGESIFGALFNRLGPYLMAALPAGYLIQRLLGEAGGVEAVLLFLSVILIPWTIHGLSQMICGGYLWIYKIWRLEREHGLPVVFDDRAQ